MKLLPETTIYTRRKVFELGLKSLGYKAIKESPLAQALIRLAGGDPVTPEMIVRDPDYIGEIAGNYTTCRLPNGRETKDVTDTMTTFRSDQPLAATPFFYWYKQDENQVLYNPGALDARSVLQPPDGKDFAPPNYNSVEWFKQNLVRMADVGIDVVLPVFWGLPGRDNPNREWSITGLKNLVLARQQLAAEAPGSVFPKIGMFFDINAFRHIRDKRGRDRDLPDNKIDLLNSYYAKYFAKAPIDFFSLVPPEFVAQIDSRPIVVTYNAEHISGYGAWTFAFLEQMFAHYFGGKKPFLIVNNDWKLPAEDEEKFFAAEYSWGSALNGPYTGYEGGIVASVGPGYDESGISGRIGNKRDRRGGDTFSNDLGVVTQLDIFKNVRIVMLETWNEWFEGTAIDLTQEYGDLYLRIAKAFISYWKTL